MAQSELTLINRIKDGCLDQLRLTLAAVKERPDHVNIDRLKTVHFARWVIIDGGTRLLFASSYDGGLDDYLNAFINQLSEGLDAIWKNCEGYPDGGAKDVEAFKTWVNTHRIEADLFYRAYPDASVPDILKALRAKQKFDAFLEEFQN